MQSPSSTSKWRCSEPFNPSINSTSINKCGLAGGQAYVKCRMDLYYVMDVDVLDQIIWVKSTRVRSDANEMKILSYFVFLIFKPVFEHWTGGETMPTNQMERHFRLLIHPCNGTRYYSRASHLNHLLVSQSDGHLWLLQRWRDGLTGLLGHRKWTGVTWHFREFNACSVHFPQIAEQWVAVNDMAANRHTLEFVEIFAVQKLHSSKIIDFLCSDFF